MTKTMAHALLGLMVALMITPALGETPSTYEALLDGFQHPDHATWGEVPLWWWEGQRMTKAMATAELEVLASKGVKAVCPIQRSPGRCDPASFTPEWWALFAHVNAECARLGMQLWAYDQVGYGNYGWLEKAAAEVQDPDTYRVVVVQADGRGTEPIHLALPEGRVLDTRAYRLNGDMALEARNIELPSPASGEIVWTPPAGRWRAVAMVAVPFPAFYLSEKAADRFIERLYGKLEDTLGTASMGTSFVGVFQDEHPPTPRDRYTEALAHRFRDRFGYAITEAIPALHFDVGPMTPKYRTDYFDAYLAEVERTYWKRVYDWTAARGLLTSHDNWGRQNIYRQSEGYIDYFRTQRWFSAPGFDDAGRKPLHQRNYYDTKIAASIARLYDRPRVWNEAFHTSGWGRTTDETVTWLTTGMVCGANLYDEHGLYYATNASTWEHAAPDPHWRQPYWKYYQTLSDFVARSSYLISQGQHVVDAAVHYPVVSLLAGDAPGTEGPDYNRYMAISRGIFDAGIDNDIIDDDSILKGEVRDGQLFAGGNGYRALVFGPEATIRLGVLEKAERLVASGGLVVFCEHLPTASVEHGRDDPELTSRLRALLGSDATRSGVTVRREVDGGGHCVYVPHGAPRRAKDAISDHIARDFIPDQGHCYATHRRVGDVDVYLLQNAEEGEGIDLVARFRTTGTPEIWDPFTGRTHAVDAFRTVDGHVALEQRLEGNTATFIVFRKDGETRAPAEQTTMTATMIPLNEQWRFSTTPTRANPFGDFRWPASDEVYGVEVRDFRFAFAGPGRDEKRLLAGSFDDSAWRSTRYTSGPHWLTLSIPEDDDGTACSVLPMLDQLAPGSRMGAATWETIAFSQTLGLFKAVPWGGHSGYPDGHINRDFIDVPEGRRLLFTRIHSPNAQRRGLRVALYNDTPRLWVNGEEQPFEDAVGNLPLDEGVNTVLLDVPGGGHGQLYVQAVPPTVSTMAEAARGSVRPDIEGASWIWCGETPSTCLRKAFSLRAAPEQARITVSAFSGYMLYVNGVLVREEIGPWSDWKKPETVTITSHLRAGENVIAIWGQFFAGQNVNKGPDALANRGVVAAFQARNADGAEWGFVTDNSWKGSAQEPVGWETPTFDDSGWTLANIRGHMGDAPWKDEVLRNLGRVTETDRPLSIDLETPYLTCFDEVPDIAYDVLPEDHPRSGWYRFQAPPGLMTMTLPTDAPVAAWVDGAPVAVEKGVVTLPSPPEGVSQVVLRVEMRRGAYAGAAFSAPLALTLAGGTIQAGPWADFALADYAGIGVYQQTVTLPGVPEGTRLRLDLGEVRAAAEVFLNGVSAGIRLARPFQFDLTALAAEGENRLEIHVANTLAPHYNTVLSTAQGPTASGLLGPVHLEHLRRE